MFGVVCARVCVHGYGVSLYRGMRKVQVYIKAYVLTKKKKQTRKYVK